MRNNEDRIKRIEQMLVCVYDNLPAFIRSTLGDQKLEPEHYPDYTFDGAIEDIRRTL